jgi:hypothetical protein
MTYLLGPVTCHDCHAPGLFWTEKGWMQRDYRTVGNVVHPILRPHRCTAHVGQPMFEFTQR